ncbi:MAG: MCE family protein [Nocardioides sp.]|jgi:phospholipid/cholesterol/gamma-HCH transport system substrate-binding protein
MSRGRSDSSVFRLGVITLSLLAVLMIASFNLQKFPGFRGSEFHAEFADASGLRKGQMVQISGIRVGRISKLNLQQDRVVVDFELDPGVKIGQDSEASVEVLNLLGEKFLDITPEGAPMAAGGTIELANTQAGYDIVSVLGDLTHTTEGIDSDRLGQALSTVADTLNAAGPEIKNSLTGLSRLSRTIASRDQKLGELLTEARAVTDLLAERRGDLVSLMKRSRRIFAELQRRRDDIHLLLVNTRQLATQLTGLVADNKRGLGPALKDLRDVTKLLKDQRDNIDATAAAMGPYVDILINIIGTGPWFDGYVPNLGGIGTGEFVPGRR